MASVDEILAAINAPDDEADNETEVTDGADDNSTIKTLRSKLKEKQSALKALGVEVTELRDFKTTTVETGRTNTAKEVFKGLELPEETAALFLKVHEGDVTPEAIKQFVVDYKLPAKFEGSDTQQTTEQKSE